MIDVVSFVNQLNNLDFDAQIVGLDYVRKNYDLSDTLAQDSVYKWFTIHYNQLNEYLDWILHKRKLEDLLILTDVLNDLAVKSGIQYSVSKILFNLTQLYQKRLYDEFIDAKYNLEEFDVEDYFRNEVAKVVQELQFYLLQRLDSDFESVILYDNTGNRVYSVSNYFFRLDENQILGNGYCSLKGFRYFGQVGFLILSPEGIQVVLDDGKTIESFATPVPNQIEIDDAKFTLKNFYVKDDTIYLDDIRITRLPDNVAKYFTIAYVRDRITSRYYVYDAFWFDSNSLTERLYEFLTSIKYSDWCESHLFDYLFPNQNEFTKAIVRPFFKEKLNKLRIQSLKTPNNTQFKCINSNQPYYLISIFNSYCKYPDETSIFIGWANSPDEINEDLISQNILRRFPAITYYSSLPEGVE